jgi:hypothetical protein
MYGSPISFDVEQETDVLLAVATLPAWKGSLT